MKITKDKDEIINGFKDNYVIVQELLQDPYLIGGRKINLRFYTLVVCTSKQISAYVYKDGFMYYTKHPYVNNSLDFWTNVTTGYIDRWVYHINPLTHNDFRKYLKDNSVDDDIIFKNIYDLIKDLILCVDIKLCQENDLNFCTTFQLFGVDIALDSELNPKIIECNKGPNLIVNDERDGQLKKRFLVKDIFKILNIIDEKDKEEHDFLQII